MTTSSAGARSPSSEPSYQEPERVVEGDRHGDREERRTLELSSEIVPYLAAPEAGAEEATKTGDWPATNRS